MESGSRSVPESGSGSGPTHAPATRFEDTLSTDPSARMRSIIQRYYMQLTAGCQRPAGECVNDYCVSNGKRQASEHQEAAVTAVNLAKTTAAMGRLFDCDTALQVKQKQDTLDIGDVMKMEDTESVPELVPADPVPDPLTNVDLLKLTGDVDVPDPDPASAGSGSGDGDVTMTMARISNETVYQRLYDVFSCAESLNKSFVGLQMDSGSGSGSGSDPNDDGESGSSSDHHHHRRLSLDLKEYRSGMRQLLERYGETLAGRIVSAVSALIGSRSSGYADSSMGKYLKSHPDNVNGIFAVLELKLWHDTQHRGILAQFFQFIASCSSRTLRACVDALTEYKDDLDGLNDILVKVHQLIAIRCFSAVMSPHEDPEIRAATKFMQLMYEANSRFATQNAKALALDTFNNEAVCETLDLVHDFENWMRNNFSFANYPFILDPFLKSRYLLIESRVAQHNEVRASVLQSVFMGQRSVMPYLFMEIRRDHLIEDTLQQLVIHESDLKKELRVKFVGEEGVDEGGVRKEFFQLIVREIFDQKYGMFVYDTDERLYWFNMNSVETGEFELIGSIVGIALYNSVLLDAHFPLVVYKKLMGENPVLDDLKNANPMLHRSMIQLLEMDPGLVEGLELTFQVSFERFGEMVTHDLVQNGADVVVNGTNRREYVEKHVHWLLVESVQRQFEAFKRGFDRVAAGRALKLFRPDELDLLITGSTELDFEAFEKATAYEPPFHAGHTTVKHFWEVIHSLSLEDKKQFLSFATGSNRAPIKGLGSLKFVISRHGGDSDRLPSSHTCFNHFLLPQYKTKEKLRQKLMLALENSEGFGML